MTLAQLVELVRDTTQRLPSGPLVKFGILDDMSW